MHHPLKNSDLKKIINQQIRPTEIQFFFMDGLTNMLQYFFNWIVNCNSKKGTGFKEGSDIAV